MTHFTRTTFAALLLLGSAGAAYASMNAMNPMVGGQAMMASQDIVDNAVNSADHTTLVAAVKAAGLVATLKSKGPFTVFAPTNEAFAALPAGTVATLLKPENKAALASVLTYHVVAGRMDFRRHQPRHPGRKRQRGAEDRRRRHADRDDERPAQHRSQGREGQHRRNLDL